MLFNLFSRSFLLVCVRAYLVCVIASPAPDRCFVVVAGRQVKAKAQEARDFARGLWFGPCVQIA